MKGRVRQHVMKVLARQVARPSLQVCLDGRECGPETVALCVVGRAFESLRVDVDCCQLDRTDTGRHAQAGGADATTQIADGLPLARGHGGGEHYRVEASPEAFHRLQDAQTAAQESVIAEARYCGLWTLLRSRGHRRAPHPSAAGAPLPDPRHQPSRAAVWR